MNLLCKTARARLLGLALAQKHPQEIGVSNRSAAGGDGVRKTREMERFNFSTRSTMRRRILSYENLPPELKNLIYEYTAFTNESLRAAVKLYCADKPAAVRRYGAMNAWDVSRVTDMSKLFSGQVDFGKDEAYDFIRDWDTSSVTNMRDMFHYCHEFNHDVSAWDTSAVTNMRWTFMDCSTFNCDIGRWNTASVVDMYGMFAYSYAFDQDISGWDVRGVKTMRSMLAEAYEFDQDISGWNVSAVTDWTDIFDRDPDCADPFDLRKSPFDTHPVTPMDY